jgi:hypothetical protein
VDAAFAAKPTMLKAIVYQLFFLLFLNLSITISYNTFEGALRHGAD